jgi:hypothetical protein
MEQYWDEIGSMEGYEEFEKEGWNFKVSKIYETRSLVVLMACSMIV